MAQLKKKKAEMSDEELLKQSIDWVNSFYRYYAEHIERARNFLMFLYVDQWEINIRQARENLSKPTLQFNKLTPLIRSILGDQRNNSPALTVRGLSKEASQNDIDLREDLLRQIHYDSDADIIFQIASKHALECGWGAARVVIEYENDDTLDQCLRIKPITDFQAAFWDPSAQLPDKSDGDFCGVYTVMSKDKFKKLNPKIDNPQSAPAIGSNYYLRWTGRDDLIICELYYKEFYTKEIVQLSDGNTLERKEAEEVIEKQAQYMGANPDFDMLGFQPLEIVNSRKVKAFKIKHIKFIQNKILEQTEYPGQLLPVVYFEGDSTVIDGERIPLPYVQDGIDQQKLINYIGSEMAYAILRARKETVIGTPGMFQGFEAEWRDADKVQGPLMYNVDKGDKPEFITPPVFNPALIQHYQNTVDDLNQSLGTHDEARGQATNAIAYKAIDARQRAANKPVNVYNDNWQRGIKQIGKVILDLIPHIYDTHRNIMGRGADGQSRVIEINKPMGFKLNENGDIDQHIENDMSVGKYDIEVRVDGSYDSQQAEAMNIMIELAKVNPQISTLIPDLLAENSGLENSQKLVERLKTLLPPQILAQEEGKPMPPPQPPPPNPEMELQKMKMQLMMQQNQTKEKQLGIDEQKVMLQAQLAGLEHEVSMEKARAEVRKAVADEHIAMIRHNTTVHTNNAKIINSKQKEKRS